jgi:5-methylthioadenosine/S-adenosylhomocysteine deaminase
MQDFDLVLRCGHFVSMAGGEASAQNDVFLGCTGSKITAVLPWSKMNADSHAKPQWRTHRFIDARKKAVLPGLVNAHSHLPMSLFRGLADDLPFSDWLNKYILPLEGRVVNAEFVKLGTELSLLEALLSGTTQIYDMYFFEDEIAEVVDRVGARAVLGENVFDYEAPDNKGRTGNDWKILDRMVERYKGHPRITPFIAPHAPYSCSDDTIRKVMSYAEAKKLWIGMHVSETRPEVEASLKQYGKSPVERLYELGMMKLHCVFAHGVHLSDHDISLLKKCDTAVVNNPECNMKLGSGIAPITRLIAQGITVALGTDGPASNNDLNMFKEMDVAAKAQKYAQSDNTAMTAATALKMATWNGAKAFQQLNELGSLEVGKRADFIVVDLEVPNLQPLHDVVSQLVYAASGSEVETVVVDGKILIDERQPRTIDREDLYDRIAHFRKRAGF